MRAARDGDRESYRQLLEALGDFLEAYFRRMLYQPELAEDAVQESLLTLHRVRHTWDASRPFLPWALAIARHQALDLARKHGRRRRREVAGEETTIEPVAAPAGAEHRLDVERVLSQLPEGQREALVLTQVQGLSHAEAAACLGTNANALKAKVHRALQAARRVAAGNATTDPQGVT
ncbi:MAG: sigma-70 family RNA polymerase sigma factor [Acidobacteriota bacterium]